MNEKEAAFLLGVSREKIAEIINDGVPLPISKTVIRLEVTRVGDTNSISDEQIDTFIAAFEAEDPGRNPPIAVRRALLTEANHRCGICRRPVARLSFHHLLEWEKVKHHDPKHMLAVCGTCHDNCTIGVIDKKCQEIYKAKLQTPHYLPDGDMDVMKKRQRDLDQMTLLFSQLPRSVLDHFFYEASGQYMPMAFLDFWGNVVDVLKSVGFHLYDNNAEQLIHAFAQPIDKMTQIASQWGHPTGPGDKLTFSGMENLTAIGFHEAIGEFVILNRTAYAAYKKTYTYLRENYLELDFEAMDAAGLSAYAGR